VGSCLVCTRQRLKQPRRRPAALAAQMLAQQLTGFGIKQTDEHRVQLHMYLASYPARRRSAVSRFNFDTTIQVNRALSIQGAMSWVIASEGRYTVTGYPR